MPRVLARKGYFGTSILFIYNSSSAIQVLFSLVLHFFSPLPSQHSGKLNGVDLLQEVKGEAEDCLETAQSMISAESEAQDESELKASEVFMNGSDLKSDEGSVTELKDSR